MFKNCMKNYVNSLKYVFVALGVMFIAFVLGAQTTVNRSVKEVKTMVASIEETTQTSDLSLERIGDSFSNTFSAIKHNINPAVIGGEEAPEEVQESIGAAIGGVLTNYAAYLGDIISYVAAAIAGIIIAIILFFVIFILVTIFGGTLISMFGRYDVHKDHIVRIVLEQVVRVFIVAVWIGVILLLSLLSTVLGIIVAVLFPLAYCYIALFSTWLTAGDNRRPKYVGYVTFKSTIILFASNLVQILIGVAFAGLLYLIFGVVVAAMFAVAMIVLAAANVNINACAIFFDIPEVKAVVDGIPMETPEAPAVAETPAAPQITLEPVKPVEEVKPEAAPVAEVKPEEVKPEEVKPEEVKPEEVKPEEIKPEEVKPEEAPAEEAKPEGQQ